jgi:small subunit ribosomal protein S2
MVEKIKKTKQEIEEDESEIYKGKELLVDIETYLKSGIHIGTKFKSGDMRKYIFKKRKDGLMVFNIETIDKRIRQVAKELAKYDAKDIAVVCRRLYGHTGIKKFSKMTGAREFTGRFIPGTITNPEARIFYEPKIVLICDPISDAQALKEAFENHIPIISLAGSESPIKRVDIVIPVNNKGRKALALIFYLLTREFLIEKGEIQKEAFTTKIEDFEYQMDENQKKKFSVKKNLPRRNRR